MQAKDMSDPDYVAAVTDLLGLLAYGELAGYTRLTASAQLAPTLLQRAETCRMAVTEFKQYERLAARLTEIGRNPQQAMQPFVQVLDWFHTQTSPSDWWESLINIYVGDGIARDFYLEMSSFVDPETAGLIRSVFADRGQAEFVLTEVRSACELNPALSGRLALWARRMVGEALSQAQRVSAERDSLPQLLLGGDDGLDLEGVGKLFDRLTARHQARMAALGMAA